MLDLLILLHRAEISHSELEEKLKKTFFKSFSIINQNNPNLEKRISDEKGLMIKLFEQLASRKKTLNRKVTFMD